MDLITKKWRETDFIKRTEQSYHLSASYFADKPALLLAYETKQVNTPAPGKTHTHTLPMQSTPCHYGGQRWWFTAPCCGSRVRVLYLNLRCGDVEHMTPQCRICLDLHYASQMSSYIERHKTYERHLLANYGLYWAEHRYTHELKQHYLEMTPELWALRTKSIVEWNTHVINDIVKCDLMILKHNIRTLKSLKREEDRQLWIAHMQQQERALHTSELVKLILAHIACEVAICQYHTQGIDPIPAMEAFLEESERYRQYEKHLHKQEQGQEELTAQHFEQRVIGLEATLKQMRDLKAA